MPLAEWIASHPNPIRKTFYAPESVNVDALLAAGWTRAEHAGAALGEDPATLVEHVEHGGLVAIQSTHPEIVNMIQDAGLQILEKGGGGVWFCRCG